MNAFEERLKKERESQREKEMMLDVEASMKAAVERDVKRRLSSLPRLHKPMVTSRKGNGLLHLHKHTVQKSVGRALDMKRAEDHLQDEMEQSLLARERIQSDRSAARQRLLSRLDQHKKDKLIS